MSRHIKTSLNISTYNWPQALNLCLLSVMAQKVLPDEVIIGDDGSTEETKALIDKFKNEFPMPLIHVWQPDEGFQLARIRNKAIAASTGDYIIQVDGDLILHPDFIADHVDFAKKGSFVTGSRVMLKEDLSAQLLKSGSIKVNLFSEGIKNKSNGYRVKFLRNYMASRYRAHDMYYMRGCNMAFWREDLIMVNGYNEEFTGWGREDNEVAVRLINSGIKKRIIKFAAVVFHIYHPEKSRGDLDRNDDMLQEAIELKKVHCPVGLDQYL
jgi:glycosyltransferase involved in cell wall biosynthesis